MYKISTGRIQTDEKGNARILTEPIIGRIDKVVIRNNPKRNNNDDAQFILKTVDGEEVINKKVGNEDYIVYPKRYGTGYKVPRDGKIINEPTIPFNTSGEMFSNVGVLVVELKNAGENGFIENVIITVD